MVVLLSQIQEEEHTLEFGNILSLARHLVAEGGPFISMSPLEALHRGQDTLHLPRERLHLLLEPCKVGLHPEAHVPKRLLLRQEPQL